MSGPTPYRAAEDAIHQRFCRARGRGLLRTTHTCRAETAQHWGGSRGCRTAAAQTRQRVPV